MNNAQCHHCCANNNCNNNLLKPECHCHLSFIPTQESPSVDLWIRILARICKDWLCFNLCAEARTGSLCDAGLYLYLLYHCSAGLKLSFHCQERMQHLYTVCPHHVYPPHPPLFYATNTIKYCQDLAVTLWWWTAEVMHEACKGTINDEHISFWTTETKKNHFSFSEVVIENLKSYGHALDSCVPFVVWKWISVWVIPCMQYSSRAYTAPERDLKHLQCVFSVDATPTNCFPIIH